MAVTNIDICNTALRRIGAEPIVALSDDTKGAACCNLRYESCKRYVLRKHPWNRCTKRAILAKPGTTTPVVLGIANYDGSGAASFNSLVIGSTYYWTKNANDSSMTCGATTLSNSGIFQATATLVSFAGTIGAGFTATIDTLTNFAPAFGFSYQYTLPSDNLRVLEVDQVNVPYKLEGNQLLSDNINIEIRYVYDVTDVTIFDQALFEAIAAYLAWDISYSMTQNMNLRTTLYAEWKDALKAAKTPDSQEEFPTEVGANYFLQARVLPNDPAIPKRDWPS